MMASQQPYQVTADLLTVTRRIATLALERTVLAASAHDPVASAHAEEVEREMRALESALEAMATMLDEDAADAPRLGIDPGVRQELETHMLRVEQLANERDVLEAAIAAEPGARGPESMLAKVERELGELEQQLDALARQVGGLEGSLGWAVSPRSEEEEHEEQEEEEQQEPERKPGLDMPPAPSSPVALPEPESESREDDGSESSDSDNEPAWALRSPASPLAREFSGRDTARRRRSAGFGRVGDRTLSLAKEQVSQAEVARSKRAEARAQSRALMEGGLTQAMKGVRPR